MVPKVRIIMTIATTTTTKPTTDKAITWREIISLWRLEYLKVEIQEIVML